MLLREHQEGFHQLYIPFGTEKTAEANNNYGLRQQSPVNKLALGMDSQMSGYSVLPENCIENIWSRKDKGEKMYELFQLRWNLEEFRVDYPELMNKTAVGKYFLEELVDETGPKMSLTQKIEYPKAFWLELVSNFTNCLVLDQQKKI